MMNLNKDNPEQKKSGKVYFEQRNNLKHDKFEKEHIKKDKSEK